MISRWSYDVRVTKWIFRNMLKGLSHIVLNEIFFKHDVSYLICIVVTPSGQLHIINVQMVIFLYKIIYELVYHFSYCWIFQRLNIKVGIFVTVLLMQVSGKLDLEEALKELFRDTRLLEARRNAAKEAFRALSSGIVANVWNVLSLHVLQRAFLGKTWGFECNASNIDSPFRFEAPHS